MYYTNLPKPLSTNKFFVAGLKIIEFLKLSIKPGMYKNTDNREWLTFLLHSTPKNLTVVDIGTHKREYLFEMLKVAGHCRKLVAFETDDSVYNYLIKMKKFLRLKNVDIETISVNDKVRNNVSPAAALFMKDVMQTATVIDMKGQIQRKTKASATPEILDDFFLSNQIKPGLLKIKAEGNELEILKGSIQTLERYKPIILLESHQTERNRENLLATFQFLTDIDYAGFFILDTMKIPLSSFDFNIYQNKNYGFYCNNFLFE